MKIPTYLHQNSYGIYYFRYRLPKTLRDKYGKTEIKKSLRTINRHHALQLARKLAVAIQQEENQLMPKKTIYQDFMVHIDQNGIHIEIAPEDAALLTNDQVQKLLELAKQKIQEQTAEPQITTPQQPSIHYLQDLIDEYVNFKKDEWTAKTKDENIAIYNLLIEILGNTNIKTVNGKVALQLHKDLQKLPSNRKKIAKYNNLSILELLQEDIPEDKRVSNTTVSKYLRRISQLFIYAVDCEYIDRNPFRNIKTKAKSKSNEKAVVAFTDDEVNTILSSLQSFKNNGKDVHKYWIPTIAAYTGMRIEEICQLHNQNIQQIDDINCIVISDLENDQNLKTKAAKRIVPIHSKLIEFGFLDYVSHHQDLLFGLEQDEYGKYSSTVSKWFTRHRTKIIGANKNRTTGKNIIYRWTRKRYAVYTQTLWHRISTTRFG